MAMTIVEMAKGMKDQVMAGILLQWARQSVVFQRIPFENVDSFYLKTWQVESVTDAVFRQIGATYTETKDNFSELTEGIYLLGGKIDIDRALRLPGQKEIDAYAENLLLQSERFRYAFTDKLLNGDRTVRPDEFNGLKKRLTDLGGNQVIDASALDLSASSANRHTFLDYVDQAIFECREGKPDLIITSKKGHWAMTRVARREGLLDVTRDQFDRELRTYQGIPLMWAGTKGDQSTEVITATEGTGSNETSFYFVRFGAKDLTGIQMHEPRRIFDDITDDGVTHRVVFEWPVGLSMFHKKAAVRLHGVVPW